MILKKSVTYKSEHDNISEYYHKQFPRNLCIMDVLYRMQKYKCNSDEGTKIYEENTVRGKEIKEKIFPKTIFQEFIANIFLRMKSLAK